MDQINENKKPHRKKQAGAKLNKKKNTKKEDVVKPKNVKAFAFHSIKKAERAVRRTADFKEKKFHNPVVDRSSVVPPPIVVAVVGPPKVGKTTLIKCLVKNFLKRKITTINGPVSIVSSKKQRLTFLECNNDFNSMIDISKVADLVLLMVDASFGFEMEIFEFLHISKVHGEMKIIGVLTHLDSFGNNKRLKKTKKILKNRFWKDVYPGAKLFYLSGIVNEEYQKMEIHNLGRFISVMKYRPLQWRSSHPYVLVDRIEDVTDPELIRQNNKSDRTVCFYGYVRGTHFKNKTSVHLAGLGDFTIDDMSYLNDPCSFPDELKKRSLDDRERLIYAPMSGVGGVLFDKDAVYIETKGINLMSDKKRSGDKEKMLETLKNMQTTIDGKMAAGNFQLFSNQEEGDDDGDEDGNDEEEDDDGSEDGKDDDENERDGREEVEGDMDVDGNENLSEPWKLKTGLEENDDDDDDDDMEGDDDDEDEEEALDDEEEEEDDDVDMSEDDHENVDGALKWKVKLREKGNSSFLERLKNINNIQSFVYGTEIMNLHDDKSTNDSEEQEKETYEGKDNKNNDNKIKINDGGDDFLGGFLSLSDHNSRFGSNKLFHQEETSKQLYAFYDFNKLDVQELVERVKDCFVSGMWDEDEDAETLLKRDAERETPEERRERRMKAKLLERKRRQKEMFDMLYDEGRLDGNGTTADKNYFETLKEEMAQQAQLNRSEFESLPESARVEFEGFRPGLYVRMQIRSIPCEFIEYFDPTYPIVVGGLLTSEQNIGYVTVNFKKHRWHKKVLKTNDPVIFSLGWRRFQTIPVYSIQDHNGRNRQIKYTPNHLHCHATFWGPITPQGSGIVAIDSLASNTKEFRISGTGNVCEIDKSFAIVKKLKLVGTPFLIHQNTAFIQGMFNSSLEVAKFELASIRTVSGIRGQIKKSIKNGATLLKKFKSKMADPILPGAFRATFEDKILMSDIVFMRTWYKTSVDQFYNPVTNLLLSQASRDAWRGMKTAGQIRREKNIKRDVNEDNLYKPIARPVREYKPLQIPRELQRQLPFRLKPKTEGKTVGEIKRIAVVKEPHERKVSQMMKQLQAIYDQKRKNQRVIMRERASKHRKEIISKNKAKAAKKKR
ncbi:hypothetical protein HELRODRAFT_192665 [Helobdella robusta]|uniref:Bms1-type G domain-containing protein n=1 Tax=Helobdella robusta TaxID=6412 RepID=T1FU63_HELRO|nr:hypothetical protein HELRODRAFT_192665 [Helobdella robusta]ESN99952.1 hypothetical protein HELRODRAFT_192665 [Helobdella robusta]